MSQTAKPVRIKLIGAASHTFKKRRMLRNQEMVIADPEEIAYYSKNPMFSVSQVETKKKVLPKAAPVVAAPEKLSPIAASDLVDDDEETEDSADFDE